MTIHTQFDKNTLVLRMMLFIFVSTFIVLHRNFLSTIIIFQMALRGILVLTKIHVDMVKEQTVLERQSGIHLFQTTVNILVVD